MNHPETETPQQTQPENHAHSAKHKKTSKRELIRQRSIYALPNSFTLAALFAAFFAITQSMHGRYESAAISVFIAMLAHRPLHQQPKRVWRTAGQPCRHGELWRCPRADCV